MKINFLFSLSANYKKTFAGLGILLMLIPAGFFSIPQKAEAIVMVENPASTAASIAATEAAAAALIANEQSLFGAGALPFTAGDNLRQLKLKEVGPIPTPFPPTSWDGIAYAAGQVLLQNLSDSIIQWIRSGFKGSPGFITNYEKFFLNVADQTTGRFMKEYLSPEVYKSICGAWAPRVLLALNLRATKAKKYRCTVNSVVANVEKFIDRFDRGGWKAWLAMTGRSTNDPVGLYLTTSSDLINELMESEKNARTESQANAGFLSVKTCVEEAVDEWTDETVCLREESVSPGKWVQTQLSAATGIDFQKLGMADELNEVIMAIIGQVISMTLREIKK